MNLGYTAATKFLGIHINETLKWNSNVQSLANKLSNVSFMIKPLKGVLSPNMIRNIYFTKFQSLLWVDILFFGLGGDLNGEYLEYKRERQDQWLEQAQ